MPISPISGGGFNPIPSDVKAHILKDINTLIKDMEAIVRLTQEYAKTKDPKIIAKIKKLWEKMTPIIKNLQSYKTDMYKNDKKILDNIVTTFNKLKSDIKAPTPGQEHIFQNMLNELHDDIQQYPS